MAAPSVDTPTPAQGDAPIAQAIQADAQDIGHKVFVGNLPFGATGESIKEIFGKVGEVTDAQIIHRGTRSLGYGFVTYTSEEDATKAVSQLDKTEINGRQVNVEVAKPMPTNGGAAARAPRKAAKKAAEFAATKETAQEAQEGEQAEGGEQAPKKKARKARKPRGPRTARVDDETEEAGDAPNAVSDAADQLANTHLDGEGAAPRTRKPRARKPRKGKAAAPAAEGESLAQEGSSVPAATAPKPRQPRRRGPPAGSESKTLLFVGNLSFSVTNESLAAAFEGCSVKSATVVTRKFGQSAGRSKGFAFVDFSSPEDQKKALEQYQGKDLDGRPLSLKVAIEPEAAGEGEKAAAADKQAARKDEKKDVEDPEASIVAS
ncbi:hypothetical protein JCM10213_007914 [Rhodosporidiobolus nylandii]